ncbi:hypothetical protein SPSYN_00921 [Sporotomaculum syntrophicum]|uniref:Uncharacterized protein n=1 Tax=Sporotomaculum syntrophicum TaxID=182264 RepID=A0A9D2WS88_9FIRM|nr:hypothetical protein SPSYN_00921 [Sporotomaculum syntrophicum]
MLQIHYQEPEADYALGGLFQACHNTGQAIAALPFSKLGFNGITLACVLSLKTSLLFL